MGSFLVRGPRVPTVLFPLAGAAIDLWFANNQYTTALSGVLSCSRASIGYAKNLDGTLTQFGNDTLRIGVGTGLLVRMRGEFHLQSDLNRFSDGYGLANPKPPILATGGIRW